MLSLSMIMRNEAERLERCLASVAGFVDEMVLLDTGSSDATIAIAQSCGAVVHQLPWPGDFAPAPKSRPGAAGRVFQPDAGAVATETDAGTRRRR